MAYSTNGSSALKFDDSERIKYLNGLKASSLWGLKTILKELNEIDGYIIKGSVLSESIGSFGIKDVLDIDNVINEIDNEKEKGPDELKTSVVDEGKIKELVEEYREYKEKGLNDEEISNKIYNENKGKLPSKELESFLKTENEKYKKQSLSVDQNPSKSPFDLNGDLNGDLKKEEIKIVEEKIETISEEIREKFDESSNFKEAVKFKIESILKEGEIKTEKEEIEDLSELIAEELKQNKNSETDIVAKTTELEIIKWTQNHTEEINEYKKEVFEKNFLEETQKLNSDLKSEDLIKIKEYSAFIAETIFVKNIIDGQKNEALLANKDFSPGELERGWTDLKTTTNFLVRKPKEILEIKDKYENIKGSLKNVNLPNFKEINSFEDIISNFNNQGTNKLFNNVQKRLDWVDKFDKITGGRLNKTIINYGEKIVSRIGNQTIKEFASNSLGVIAKEGLQKGFSTILSGILKGGVKTVAGLGKTAVTGAEVVAGTAVSATGIGAIVVAALAVLKKIKSFTNKITDSLGINLKKWAQENFGKIGGVLIEGAGFLVAIPLLLVGAISAIALPIILVFGLVFGGLFSYQTYLGNSISSLVQPEGSDDSSYEETVDDGSYISSSGNINLPIVDLNKKVTGKMIVDMASALINKVCYYYGGGHGHFYSEPIKGIDENWNKKSYIINGNTLEFGNNTQFNSNTSRFVYGLDCSSFVSWVYYQFGINVNGSASTIYVNAKKVNKSDLQPGDIGYYSGSEGNHIGIFYGKDSNGNLLWIHDGSGNKLDICGGQPGFVKMGTYSKFNKFARIL